MVDASIAPDFILRNGIACLLFGFFERAVPKARIKVHQT
jgi:hypothetical protein